MINGNKGVEMPTLPPGNFKDLYSLLHTHTLTHTKTHPLISILICFIYVSFVFFNPCRDFGEHLSAKLQSEAEISHKPGVCRVQSKSLGDVMQVKPAYIFTHLLKVHSSHTCLKRH